MVEHVLVAVSAGDAQPRPGNRQPRPRHLAGFDGIAQGHVAEITGTDVTRGGEPGHQGALGVDDTTDHGAMRRLEVVRKKVLLEVRDDVRVHVHQAGEHERIRQIDQDRASGDLRVAVTDGDDAFPLDSDDRVIRHTAIRGVQ